MNTKTTEETRWYLRDNDGIWEYPARRFYYKGNTGGGLAMDTEDFHKGKHKLISAEEARARIEVWKRESRSLVRWYASSMYLWEFPAGLAYGSGRSDGFQCYVSEWEVIRDGHPQVTQERAKELIAQWTPKPVEAIRWYLKDENLLWEYPAGKFYTSNYPQGRVAIVESEVKTNGSELIPEEDAKAMIAAWRVQQMPGERWYRSSDKTVLWTYPGRMFYICSQPDGSAISHVGREWWLIRDKTEKVTPEEAQRVISGWKPKPATRWYLLRHNNTLRAFPEGRFYSCSIPEGEACECSEQEAIGWGAKLVTAEKAEELIAGWKKAKKPANVWNPEQSPCITVRQDSEGMHVIRAGIRNPYSTVQGDVEFVTVKLHDQLLKERDTLIKDLETRLVQFKELNEEESAELVKRNEKIKQLEDWAA